MNILEILKESILLEAVRINNGAEAIELIRNNKLGVKIQPSWKTTDENELSRLIDFIIKGVGINNAVFAIQLAANKIPVEELKEVIRKGAFLDLVGYKNRPWAKQVPGYNDFASFNNKPLNFNDMIDLLNKVKQEEQNHGHGNKNDVETLYNDGRWTLQIPHSFKGAKSASFYGRKGEKQTPTEWCTRTTIDWYNHYAKDSPLYIIRNWENGNSYQVSFNKDVVNFLDQKDVKGDPVTRGDLRDIPDKLLSYIKYNGKSLLDYKKADEKSSKGEMSKGSKFKDPTSEIADARWSNDKHVKDNVYKSVWENFSSAYEDKETDKMSEYMIHNKLPGYVKHDGNYAVKYFFEDEPDFFILMEISKGGSKPGYSFYWDGDSDLEEMEEYEFYENLPNSDKLLEIALEDFGFNKWEKRFDNSKESQKNEKEHKLYKKGNKLLEGKLKATVVPYIAKLLDYRLDDGDDDDPFLLNIDYKNGGFIPSSIKIWFLGKGEVLNSVSFNKTNNGYSFDLSSKKRSILKEKGMTDAEINDSIKAINEKINKAVKEYSKEMIHDKDGANLRQMSRAKAEKEKTLKGPKISQRLQFEEVAHNYFPY